MTRRFAGLVSCALSALWGAGCATVENDLAGEQARRLRSLDEAVAVAGENRRPAVLRWDRAVAVMLEHNPDLQQARLDLRSARRDSRRVWDRLIPYFSLRAFRFSNLNQRNLRDFSTTQFAGDVGLYLNRYAELPQDLYAAALAQIRADTAWRMAVKLRMLGLFTRCEALAAAEDAAARARALDELMARHPDYFRGRDRDDARAAARETAELARAAGDELGEWLGVAHETVGVDPATLPAWPEAGEKLLDNGLPQEGNPAFAPDPDWVALMAVEGAAAIARRRGLMRVPWPSLDGYLNLPGVRYDAGGGFSRLDFAQTQVSANLYWNSNWILDADLQWEQAADHEKLMNEAFARNMDNRLRQMATQARLLREAKVRDADLLKRIEAVRQVAPRLEPRDAAQLLERSVRWQAERDELRHQRRTGLAQLWFLSDNNREVLPHEALENP